MHRVRPAIIALVLLLPIAGSGIAFAGSFSAGPWNGRIWPWGNDTGGIIPYSPEVTVAAYRDMAADYCARWGRLSQITSVDRKYRDYVGFTCIDRPGRIH